MSRSVEIRGGHGRYELVQCGEVRARATSYPSACARARSIEARTRGAVIPCICCSRAFRSADVRRQRLCPKCRSEA